jgi:magnesium-protoporphyrin IX monomethyl ester (oxidative) cyclase
VVLPKKIEKVFLLFPPVRLYRETMKLVFPPLGVGYIAAVIRNEVDVRIMDAVAEGFYHEVDLDEDFLMYGSSYEDILRRISDYKPDIVGITCLFSSVFPVVREVCRRVKALAPDILTITGGTYPSFLAEELLQKEPNLDMIALGEGEYTMRDLIRALRSGADLSSIDGLAFKDDGKVRLSPKKNLIENLDEIPFPARDLLPMDLYPGIIVPHSFSAKHKMNTPMITSRGCPAKCSFCSSSKFWGYKFRWRSAGNVLDEIGELVSRYGIKEIQFEDDNFTANKKRAKEVFRGIIERGYKISFNMPNGIAVWTMDEEMIHLMKEAGCYEVTLAFESGCQEVLDKIIKKPLDLEKARETTRLIHKAGIRTNAFYIFGFPGETREQMQETFRFARKVKTNMAYFFIANPLPGTELYERAKSEGLLPEDFNFENLTFTKYIYRPKFFDPREIERMAGREFLKYNFFSFFRHPLVIFKKAFVDLFFRRPRYTLGLLARVYRRNLK